MATNNIARILVAPPDNLETNLVKEAALILNKDPYEARLLLSGKIPKLIAYYSNSQEAESVANRLKALGLVAVVCSDKELRESPSTRLIAHTMKFGDREITFWDKGSQMMKMEPDEVFLILKGRLQSMTGKEVTKTSLKFSLPATLLTGGFPIWRKVKETTKETVMESGYFVKLYDRMSSEPRVEIFENYFDFSPLGSEIAPSSLTNLNRIIAEMREIFPLALFDDKLVRPYGTNLSATSQDKDLELNCKLIYLYYQAIHNLNSQC
jgi:hypothetical protein